MTVNKLNTPVYTMSSNSTAIVVSEALPQSIMPAATFESTLLGVGEVATFESTLPGVGEVATTTTTKPASSASVSPGRKPKASLRKAHLKEPYLKKMKELWSKSKSPRKGPRPTTSSLCTMSFLKMEVKYFEQKIFLWSILTMEILMLVTEIVMVVVVMEIFSIVG